MRRAITTILILSALSVSPALAQPHPAQAHTRATMHAATPSDSTAAMLIGTWEGSVDSEHAAGSAVKLVFTRDATLKVAASVVFNGQLMVATESTELKVDGSNVTWSLSFMEQPCRGTGVLSAGTLKGEFTCGDHGVTYLAKKK